MFWMFARDWSKIIWDIRSNIKVLQIQLRFRSRWMETPRYQTHDTKLGLFALFASIFRYKGSNAVGEGCECFFVMKKQTHSRCGSMLNPIKCQSLQNRMLDKPQTKHNKTMVHHIISNPFFGHCRINCLVIWSIRTHSNCIRQQLAQEQMKWR